MSILQPRGGTTKTQQYTVRELDGPALSSSTTEMNTKMCIYS